jgi:acyl-coenzyme A synthetase/AMP-(fatty) acid ligase
MAPIVSDITVHLRTDRSVTQFMQENISNTAPSKVIYEDTLMGRTATYGGFRLDVFRIAHALRHSYGLQTGNIVSIICASCVCLPLQKEFVRADLR